MSKRHTRLVADLAAQIVGFYERRQPFHIYHGSTNSTRILTFKRSEAVDASQLDRVLKIDRESRTALVEPNVPMDKLVAITLKHGLLPPVVMEFPGITVGGGVQGGAGESSSFRYGCFNQTCLSYEMILADGQVVQASPKKNADLFYGTAGSFGSLGVMTAIKLKLIPAHKYVQLTYLPVKSFEAAVAAIEEAASKNYDFIDGIMFGQDHGVIMTGRLSDQKYGKLRRFSRARDPWFYLHAEAIDQRAHKLTETIPLTDYLFRYDRGAFWVGRYAFDRLGIRFTSFTRWLLNPILHTRKLYEALQTSGVSQEHIVQDLALPRDTAVKFMKFIHRHYGVYPLWLCPLKPDLRSPLQSNGIDTPVVINVGVWGQRITPYGAFLTANRQIEQILRKLGGKKWFYAHSYYPEKEFWKIYDKPAYDQLRQKYAATTLPSVYEKVTVRQRHPVNTRRGLWRTIFGMARLRLR
jgi:hypothetical protein